MQRADDIARFTADDPEAVVAASFACPVCLRVDVDAAIDRGDIDAEAACSCRACETTWLVGLDAMQALRLALHPPARIGRAWRLRLRFRERVL